MDRSSIELTCLGCLEPILEGDLIHSVNTLICHEGCQPDPRFNITITKL
jgi:hypothetical protein